jgi:hypothetical protein
MVPTAILTSHGSSVRERAGYGIRYSWIFLSVSIGVIRSQFRLTRHTLKLEGRLGEPSRDITA